jgi:alkanesulfonate monooxygenase SsuD/methylene tetrahydromethanopterin reductase-like flavin-dependent oxidoreductase (luciferase family)
MAVTSNETFPAAGRLGLPVFVGLRVAEIPELQAQLAQYRAAWRDAGHPGEPSVYLRVPVYVSTTEKGAVEEPRETLTYFFERQAELARAGAGRAGTNEPEHRRAQAERMASLSYDEIRARKVAVGTVDGVIARLLEIRDALGLDGIIAELNPGGHIPAELERRSLELLAREVMPALK